MAGGGGFYYVNLIYGPLYVFFLITNTIIPYALCICTLVRAIRELPDRQLNHQYWTILVISVVPVIVMIAYIFKIVNIFDLTPVTLTISMSLVVIIIWGRRNYDFRHLAAERFWRVWVTA